MADYEFNDENVLAWPLTHVVSRNFYGPSLPDIFAAVAVWLVELEAPVCVVGIGVTYDEEDQYELSISVEEV